MPTYGEKFPYSIYPLPYNQPKENNMTNAEQKALDAIKRDTRYNSDPGYVKLIEEYVAAGRVQAELRRRKPDLSKRAAHYVAKTFEDFYSEVLREAARDGGFKRAGREHSYRRVTEDDQPEGQWTKSKHYGERFKQYVADTTVTRFDTPIKVWFKADHTGTGATIGGDDRPQYMSWVFTEQKPSWTAAWGKSDPTVEERKIISEAFEKVGEPPLEQKKEPLTLEQRIERLEHIAAGSHGYGGLINELRGDLARQEKP